MTANAETQPGGWAASTDTPRRSVFKNYTPEAPASLPAKLAPEKHAGRDAGAPRTTEPRTTDPVTHRPNECSLQSAIDTAFARAFLYQFLARAFDDPQEESWHWLTQAPIKTALGAAVETLQNQLPALQASANALLAALCPDCFESFQIAYVTAFGHAARGDCPLNEIEYGDLNADPLFQPHRLADLAAFYRAFGMEVADTATERPDHLGMELEFMSVLASREAYALEHQMDEAELVVGRAVQKKFLREHLGRWCLAFARRLARAACDPALVAFAEFTRDFIIAECARFNVAAGSQDLFLRPVDSAAEQLCSSCGIQDLPPGACSPSTTA